MTIDRIVVKKLRGPKSGQKLLSYVTIDWAPVFWRRGCAFEYFKVDVLGHHLERIAERYYNQQVEGRLKEQPILEHATQRLLHTFATKLTRAHSIKMFTATKSPARSWTEHYLYLVTVSEACGESENPVSTASSLRLSVNEGIYAIAPGPK
uniref:Uncharacterized protein AlNc14C108G6298 n=1 Tax=Albugo laibachii Nc14 TaxID=890382 RepID=F0WI91_9STRA|nr:conserved hypothetical protein [Albugo laibachii Nc14]|eukprot:CCA20970.1 conserved hypothetical protein [Albugo laibachii Nc14]